MGLAGVLTALFRLDTKQAQTSAKKLGNTLGKDLKGSLSRMSGGAGIAGNALSALGPAGIAAGVGVSALTGAAALGIRHIVQLGDQITTLSAKTGLSTDFLQKLSHAATVLDVPFETAARSASKLQVNLGKLTPTKESLDALLQLGLNLEDLKNLDAEAQFLAVGDAIKALKDPTEQAAAATALFGRGGIELLPALRDNYREVLEEAERLGLVLSEDVLQAGDALGENWETLKLVGVSLLSQAVGPLVERMADLSAAALENKEEWGEWLGVWAKTTPIGLAALAMMEALGSETEATAAKVKDAAGPLASLEQDFEALSGQVGIATEAIGDATLGIDEHIAKLIEAGKEQAEAAKDARFLGVTIAELKGLIDENGEAFETQARAARLSAEAMKDAKKAAEPISGIAIDINGALNELAANNPLEDLSDSTKGWAEALEDAKNKVEEMGVGESQIEGLRLETDGAADAQQEYNAALAAANDLAQLLGSTIGDVVGQTLAAAAAIQNLQSLGGEGGLLGGLGKSFSSGKGKGTGLVGLLGGVGGLIGAASPLISAGLQIGKLVISGIGKAFGGRSADSVMQEIGRDMGVSVTDGLAESIHASGKNPQLALASIFQEGNLGVDRFAQEIGDLFSLIQQGGDRGNAITAIEESVALLLPRLQELGPVGEAELQRIIGAAREMGIEFAGLDELIQSTFAPDTVETMAEKFGVTNAEIREMGRALGIDVQTNLERVAASVGLTAKEFTSLGSALEDKFGIPAERLAEFLESSGISAAELAEALGVNVGAGAQIAADAQAAANDRLGAGVDLAARLANELERASRASGGIRIPSGGNIPGAAAGDIVSSPSLRVVGEGGGAEVIAPVRALLDAAMRAARGGGGGGSASSDRAMEYLTGGVFAKDLARAVRDERR